MNKKAVTLFEIIISTLIFVLVMAGLVNVFISSKRYLMHAHSRVIVSELGKNFLDSLQRDVRQDTISGAGNNCLFKSSGCPAAQSLNGITYTPTYNFSNIAIGSVNLRKARVVINWNETAP